MAVNVSKLKAFGLFASVSEEALAGLASCTRSVKVAAGSLIAHEGTSNPPVVFVVEGTVRVFRSNDQGRQQILDHLGPGQAFYLPPAFSRSRMAPASAEAATDVKMLTVGPADFRRFTAEEPAIALAVLELFGTRLHHLAELTHDLSLRNVRCRLARFLVRHGAEEDAEIRWTHEEMAAKVGTVREVVSRTLRAMARDGLIQVHRNRIEILDRAALQDEAAD